MAVGASGKRHDPDAYDWQRSVADITAVLADLDIPGAHYFGYSMGGKIGFAMARYALERAHSLIIGGASPYPLPQAGPDRMLDGLKQGAEAIPSIWSAPVPAMIRARLVKNDVEALIALRTEALQHPGFAEILPVMTMPCPGFKGIQAPTVASARAISSAL